MMVCAGASAMNIEPVAMLPESGHVLLPLNMFEESAGRAALTSIAWSSGVKGEWFLLQDNFANAFKHTVDEPEYVFKNYVNKNNINFID